MTFVNQVSDILPPPGLEHVMTRSAPTLELSKYLFDDMPDHGAVPARSTPVDLDDGLGAPQLVHPMLRDEFILARANLELVQQNAELRAQLAQMAESMIPANTKRSKRVTRRTSINRGREQFPNWNPGVMKIAVKFDSPSPTASTACSSSCTSEVGESPRSENREVNADIRESSEDEISPTSPAGHHTCASEVQECHGTTVIVRNIPFEYTRDNVLELIDRHGFNGLYDLLCLPVDFQTELNHGYVFINFVTLEDAESFKNHFKGFSDWNVPSCNVCEVTWFDSTHNIDSHIQRYRDSPLMHESVEDRFKPVLFKDGLRIPFPEPTKKIRAPRRSKLSKGEKTGEPGAKQRCLSETFHDVLPL